jgi:hypothetical protein
MCSQRAFPVFDPELSGVLIKKAAELKAQVEEIAPSLDPGPKPPDV